MQPDAGGTPDARPQACALVHNPQLLVLDEPTVGVDPLLRAKIWAYLQHLTSMPGGPSILITTHCKELATLFARTTHLDLAPTGVGIGTAYDNLQQHPTVTAVTQYHCHRADWLTRPTLSCGRPRAPPQISRRRGRCGSFHIILGPLLACSQIDAAAAHAPPQSNMLSLGPMLTGC